MLFNNLRIRKRLSLIIEKRFRKNWKNTEPNSNISTDNVAVVIVNYNTKELLTLLLFSIYKNLGIKPFLPASYLGESWTPPVETP